MPVTSRGVVFAGLIPEHWVVLFQQLEPSDGPVYYYRKVHVHLVAESTNGAATRIKLQDAPTGAGPWTDRYVHPVQLQPGGETDVYYFHVQPHVRFLVYSTECGRVDGTWLKPEEQVLPYLIPGEHITLTCTTLCEMDCETANETVG